MIQTTTCEFVTQHFVVNIRSSSGFHCSVTCFKKCFQKWEILLVGSIKLLFCGESFGHSGVLKPYRCRKHKRTPSTVATWSAVMFSLIFHPPSCQCVKWRCMLLLQVRLNFEIMLAFFFPAHKYAKNWARWLSLPLVLTPRASRKADPHCCPSSPAHWKHVAEQQHHDAGWGETLLVWRSALLPA